MLKLTSYDKLKRKNELSSKDVFFLTKYKVLYVERSLKFFHAKVHCAVVVEIGKIVITRPATYDEDPLANVPVV